MDNLLDEELGERKEISYEEMVDMLCTLSLVQEKHYKRLKAIRTQLEFHLVEIFKLYEKTMKPKWWTIKLINQWTEEIDGLTGANQYLRNKLFSHLKEHKDSYKKKRVVYK